MRTLHDHASERHRRARGELLDAERELRDATVRVAALRAALPPGPEIDAATPLTTASGKPVTLGRLLGDHRNLLAYNMVFDEGRNEPRARCAVWVDGLDAVATHLGERMAVAVFSPASPGELDALACGRGWRSVALVSTQPGALTDELGLRTPGGGLEPAVTTFARDDTGTLRVQWQGDVNGVLVDLLLC